MLSLPGTLRRRVISGRPIPPWLPASTSRRSSIRGSSGRVRRFEGRSEMAIPPGVSQRDWNAAIGEFRDAVGADWVFTADADGALYRDGCPPCWGERKSGV